MRAAAVHGWRRTVGVSMRRVAPVARKGDQPTRVRVSGGGKASSVLFGAGSNQQAYLTVAVERGDAQHDHAAVVRRRIHPTEHRRVADRWTIAKAIRGDLAFSATGTCRASRRAVRSPW